MSAGERTNDSATRSTPSLQRELEVLDVLLRQRGHGNVHARQRQPLVVADRTALGDGADHVVSVDVLDDQTDVAVVDQQPVSRRGVVGELLVGGRHPVVGAFAVIDGDADGFTVRPEGGTVGEPAESDLGALQVGEDADGVPGDVGGGADPLVVGLVVGVVAVAEVQSCDVHPGLDQCPDRLVGGGGGAERTDDLSASIHV